MEVRVNVEALDDACEYVAAGVVAGVRAQAFVSRGTGQIFWRGEGIDEDDLPDDIGDSSAYVEVPSRKELETGASLALRYVAAELPELLDEVEQIFRQPGAYRRFKALLDRRDRLDAWHAFEHASRHDGLRAWCAENGFVAA